jgi:leucine dehydrogenase
MKNMDFTKLLEFDNHEMVALWTDKKTKLKAFVAIHNTNLGPATGATRYLRYSSNEEALRDALRLSRTMTYKCALAGIPYGGGKGVIMAEKRYPKTPALLRAYARRVNLLGGNFYTGEDVGMSLHDVKTMARETKYVIGLRGNRPAYWTALGITAALRAGLEEVFGTPEVSGRTFAIKGLGKVGFELCRLLYRRGAVIYAADMDSRAAKFAKRQFRRIRLVSPRDILYQSVDVLCPCALDGDINSKSIPQLRCAIVCGGANNQLASPEDGHRLHNHGILYMPDYLVNAGGLIDVVAELDRKGYRHDRVYRKVKGIGKIAERAIALAKKTNKPMSAVVDRMADARFRKVQVKRK